jgi:hypothetical protein
MAQTSRSLHFLHFGPCSAAMSSRRNVRWHSRLTRQCPLWPSALFMALLPLALGCSRREADRAQAAPRQPPVTPAARKTSSANVSQQRLRQAAAVLERYETIAAKLRFSADLMGQQMIGSGSYAQMRNPDPETPARVLSRLDLRIQVRERTATWQQVCDGKFVWTHSKLPDGEVREITADPEKGYSKRLTRIDLAKVAATHAKLRDAGEQRAAGYSGLPRLLESLAAAFDFQGQQSSRINGVSMHVFEGRWQQPLLQQLLAEKPSSPSRDPSGLPERAPDDVIVFLGQEDLFPFRIVFRRQGADGAPREMAKMELYEVRFDAPLERQQFDFTARKKFQDETSQFLKAYRQQ